MTDFNPNDSHQVEIRDDTRRVLDSLNVFQNGAGATDEQRLVLLHDIVEAARIGLHPKAKAAPASTSTGRGRKPKDPS